MLQTAPIWRTSALPQQAQRIFSSTGLLISWHVAAAQPAAPVPSACSAESIEGERVENETPARSAIEDATVLRRVLSELAVAAGRSRRFFWMSPDGEWNRANSAHRYGPEWRNWLICRVQLHYACDIES